MKTAATASMFALALVACALVSSVAQAQGPLGGKVVAPKVKPPLTAQLPDGPPPAFPPYAGYVNGKLGLVLRENGLPVPNKKGGATYKPVGGVIDLRSELAKLWNDNRGSQEAAIKNILKTPISGYRLYDPKITLASASVANSMTMAINPASKTVFVHYFIPNNKVVCKADVSFWPDPTVTMTFSLDLFMELHTNGPARDPLVLKAAKVTAYGAKVLVNSNRNAGAEGSLNGKTIDVRAKLLPAVAALNNITLRPHTNQGYTVVTPHHRLPGVPATTDLLFELSRPAPAVLRR